MANKGVDRSQKNAMRSKLEDLLETQKSLGKKIDQYHQSTETNEYREFWQDLRNKNNETIQVVSRYMVNKCNR